MNKKGKSFRPTLLEMFEKVNNVKINENSSIKKKLNEENNWVTNNAGEPMGQETHYDNRENDNRYDDQQDDDQQQDNSGYKQTNSEYDINQVFKALKINYPDIEVESNGTDWDLYTNNPENSKKIGMGYENETPDSYAYLMLGSNNKSKNITLDGNYDTAANEIAKFLLTFGDPN